MLLLKIKLNQMQFHAHIGVYPEERKIGQDIVINIALIVNNQDMQELLEDKLENTINYGPVYQIVKEIVAQKDIKLIETLAAKILQAIEDESGNKLDNIIVNIKKKNLPIDGVLDSAEVEVSAK